MPKPPPALDPANPAHSFARELRRLRLRTGDPPLGELARAMSCSHSTVSAYLNGQRLPPAKQLESFVLACNGNTADWLQRLEEVREELDRLRIAETPKSAPADLNNGEATRQGEVISDRPTDAGTSEIEEIEDPAEPVIQAAPSETDLGPQQPGVRSPRLASTKRRTGIPRKSAAVQPTLGGRITVALIPVAADNLRRLQERTKLSQTDIANRAITSYEFLDSQLRGGCELLVRDRRTGETRLVRFL